MPLTMRPLLRRQLQKTSLEMTSSFFWSSPCTFCAPAAPVRLLMPERDTRELICLQARATEDSTVASSPSMVLFCSSCGGEQARVVVVFEMVDGGE